MAPDHSGVEAAQQGRAIRAERPLFPGSRSEGQASRGGVVRIPPAAGEVRGEVDWSLLALLVAGERCGPIAVLGGEMPALASALASAGDPIVPLVQNGEGIGRLTAPQAGRRVFPVCSGTGSDLPLREASVGAIILNQVVTPPPDGSDGKRLLIHPGLLAEVHRVLRPGGIVSLIVSQRKDPLCPATLKAWLEQCGFRRNDFYLASPGQRRFTGLTPMASGRLMRTCIDLLVQGNTSRERWLRGWLKLQTTLGLLGSRTSEYVVLGRKGM